MPGANGMLRGVHLLLLFLTVALGLDLVVLRGMSSYPPSSGLLLPSSAADPSMGLPLGFNASFMPLCGNGVVNTMADYLAFYANPPAWYVNWMVTKQELTLSAAGNVTPVRVSTVVDEICDDGNRVDGDGCSADCMDFDALVSPCEVAVEGRALSYENVVFSSNGDAYAVALDGVYRLLTAADGRSVTPALVVAKGFSSVATFLLWPALYALSADGSNTVYVVSNLGATVPVWSTHLVIPGAGVLAGGQFYQQGISDLMLFCRGARRLLNVDVLGKTVWSEYARDSGKADMTVRDGDPVDVTPDGMVVVCGYEFFGLDYKTIGASFVAVGGFNGGSVCASVTNATARFWCLARVYPWTFLLRSSYPPFRIIYNTQPVLSQAEYLALTMHSSALRGAVRANPLFLSVQAEAPRGLLPGLGTTVPRGGQFLGNRAFYEGGGACVAGVWCYLDTPIGYNCLTRKESDVVVQPGAAGGGATYFSVLAESVRGVVSLENATEVEEALLRYTDTLRALLAPTLALRMAHNPSTTHLWMVRGGSLWEIGRRGASVERADGRCVPAKVSLCPPCRWSLGGGACELCPASGSGVEWLTQCVGCAGAAGQRRRLLSDASPIRVAFVVGGATAAEVSARFPGAVVASNGAAGGLAVTILTQDPQATVVDVNRAINANGVWYVITAPRAVYSAPTSPPTTTPVPAAAGWSLWIVIAIIGAGCAALAIIVLVVMYVVANAATGRLNARYSVITAGEHPEIRVKLECV